jgi:hypothetical protein
MPTPSTANFPPPQFEQEFESMVADALRSRFDNPRLVSFGRRGQSQYGIDGFDPTVPMENAIVWQATLRNNDVVSKINADLASFDAEFAEKPPSLFVVALGIARDAATQRHFQKLSVARSQEKKCSLMPLFWEDIRDELCRDPQLTRKQFSAFFEAAAQTPPKGSIESVSVQFTGRSREQAFRVVNHGSNPFTLVSAAAIYGFNDGFAERVRRNPELNPEWRGRKWDQPAKLPNRTLVIPSGASERMVVEIYRSDWWREFRIDAMAVVEDVDRMEWLAYLECKLEAVVEDAAGKRGTLWRVFPWSG